METEEPVEIVPESGRVNEEKIEIKSKKSASKNIIKNSSLSKDAWTFIEKPLSETDKKRNQIINDLGEKLGNINAENINLGNLYSVGEEHYLRIRDEITGKSKNCKKTKTDILLDLPDLKDEPSSEKKKGKAGSKKATTNKILEMRINNSSRLIESQLINLKTMLIEGVHDKLFNDLMKEFNYIELRIIIIMKLLQIFTLYPDMIENINSEKEEIIIASNKILYNLKKFREIPNFFNKLIQNQESKLSQQLLDDFEYKIKQLSSTMSLRLVDIANKRPKLIFDTKYDITLPEMVLKPYDSQLELSNLVKNNIDNGFMIFYKTLPGLGKTTMILSICKFISKCKLSSEKYKNMKVIFCCSDILQSVRVQVLRIMYNFSIKFGIGRGLSDTQYEIKNSWNVHNDDNRELIVCDYLSTYLMLKEGKHDYILFFDEPTLLTDKLKDNYILDLLVKILYFLPKHTILSSATLPQMNEIENIIINYKERNPNGCVKEVSSNKTLVGCIIKDFKNNVITPHSYCKDTKDLGILIEKIKIYPLLGKFYTLPYLMNLNEFIKSYGLNMDIERIESFDQESILENILFLLEKITKNEKFIRNEDNCFEKLKDIKIKDIIEDSYDTTKLDKEYNTVNYKKLLTFHAFKYLGCCLISTNNPIEFVKKNFFNEVRLLKEKAGIKNISMMYDNYLKEMKILKEKIDAIEINYTNENIQNEKISELLKRQPKIEFPEELQINTHKHIKIFSQHVKTYDRSMIKNDMIPESIDISSFNVDDEIKFLLYMGVGIYSMNIDPNYSNKVLEMLSDRQLAYIISDESFCYGANYQISNVIIDDDIGDEHSINTILQLIGRTSRIGKSWSGRVYLDNNTCKRIINFFESPDSKDANSEGTNISRAYSKFSDDYKEELRIKKEKEIQEKLFMEELLKKKEEEKKKDILREEQSSTKFEKDNKIKEAIDFWSGIRDTSIEVKEVNELKEVNEVKEVNEERTLRNNNDFQEDGMYRRNNFKKPTIKTTDLSDWGNIRSGCIETPNTERSEPGIYRPGSLSSRISSTPEVMTAPGNIENSRYFNSTPKTNTSNASRKNTIETNDKKDTVDKTDIDMSKYYRLRK